LANCPIPRWVLKRIFEIVWVSGVNGSNSAIYSIFGPFIESFQTLIFVRVSRALPPNVTGRTFIDDPVAGISTIHVNENLCYDSATIDVLLRTFGMFAHEGLHCKINHSLNLRGCINDKNCFEAWVCWLETEFGGSIPPSFDPHKVMASKYIDLVATALWEFNRKVGQVADYEFIAWIGLLYSFEDLPEEMDNYIPTDDELTLMEFRYVENVLNSQQHSILDDCCR
jgi:hypothetical protein